MHEREFSLLAKALPHIAARWRLWSDLELLASLPDGTVAIDALDGMSRHSVTGVIPLRLGEELKAGLTDQLARRGVAAEEVSAATVSMVVETGAVPTDRARIVHFDLRISARLETRAGVFAAAQDEEHVWHTRLRE